MKKQLLRISGLASLALLFHISGFAQEDSNRQIDDAGPRRYDEIIIKHKTDKNAKVTIEIKDGEVLVDGKPISDYDDSSLSIHRRKIVNRDMSNFSFDASPDAEAMSVFSNGTHGGGWSYNGNDNGFLPNRALLGVGSEKTADGQGVKVLSVTKGSAAEKLGLRPGDVITRIDETAVTDPRALSAIVRAHHPGDKLTLTYSRDGKVQKETAVLGKAPMAQVEPFNLHFNMPDLKELSSDNLPPDLGEYFGNALKFGIRAQDMEEGKGVKVLDVDDESTAAKAGIKEGDIITRFDGKDINSVTALTAAAHAAKEKASVKVSLVRDGKTQEVEVRVPKRLHTANL